MKRYAEPFAGYMMSLVIAIEDEYTLISFSIYFLQIGILKNNTLSRYSSNK